MLLREASARIATMPPGVQPSRQRFPCICRPSATGRSQPRQMDPTRPCWSRSPCAGSRAHAAPQRCRQPPAPTPRSPMRPVSELLGLMLTFSRGRRPQPAAQYRIRELFLVHHEHDRCRTGSLKRPRSEGQCDDIEVLLSAHHVPSQDGHAWPVPARIDAGAWHQPTESGTALSLRRVSGRERDGLRPPAPLTANPGAAR
jgi:hypothetical protein